MKPVKETPQHADRVARTNPPDLSLDEELAQLEDAIRREDSERAALLYGRHLKAIRAKCGHKRLSMSVGYGMPFEYSDPVERAVRYSCAETVSDAISALRIVRGQLAAEREQTGKTPSPSEGSNDTSVPEVSTDSLAWLQGVTRRFHLVANQLRRRREGRSTLDVADEYDVQDLLHALLRLRFDDVRREEPTPSFGAGGARIDFLLPEPGIAIEVKRIRQQGGERELADEMLIDVSRYSAHPTCKTLLFFVYDPDGLATNPAALQDVSSRSTSRLRIVVEVSPRP